MVDSGMDMGGSIYPSNIKADYKVESVIGK